MNAILIPVPSLFLLLSVQLLTSEMLLCCQALLCLFLRRLQFRKCDCSQCSPRIKASAWRLNVYVGGEDRRRRAEEKACSSGRQTGRSSYVWQSDCDCLPPSPPPSPRQFHFTLFICCHPFVPRSRVRLFRRTMGGNHVENGTTFPPP